MAGIIELFSALKGGVMVSTMRSPWLYINLMEGIPLFLFATFRCNPFCRDTGAKYSEIASDIEILSLLRIV